MTFNLAGDVNRERFAMKFAENFVDQQGPEQLLPFLSDAMETPIDNPLTCLQDDTMVTKLEMLISYCLTLF